MSIKETKFEACPVLVKVTGNKEPFKAPRADTVQDDGTTLRLMLDGEVVGEFERSAVTGWWKGVKPVIAARVIRS